MLRHFLALLMLIASVTGAWAEIVYLRCQHTEPLNQAHGRYVIVTIDLMRHKIEMHDHHNTGTTVTNYIVDQKQEALLKADRYPKRNSDEWLEIDRVSGRIAIKIDATADADKLWNVAKRQIGGFDLSDGKKLVMTSTLNCLPTKPIL